MKEKTFNIFLITTAIILFIISFTIDVDKKTNTVDERIKVVENKIKEDTSEKDKPIIEELRKQYNNNDIVAIIEIPNVFKEIVVQTNNNDHYLHYDITGNKNINGEIFMDFRNDIKTSKKLLIYGHSDPEGKLPFVKINNFSNKDFFDNNRYIYLYDNDSVRKYEVFSSYTETKDFDYVNLDSFNGLTWTEHLNKLRDKSIVHKDIEFTDDSKIIILQTCSFDENISEYNKYILLIGVEIL